MEDSLIARLSQQRAARVRLTWRLLIHQTGQQLRGLSKRCERFSKQLRTRLLFRHGTFASLSDSSIRDGFIVRRREVQRHKQLRAVGHVQRTRPAGGVGWWRVASKRWVRVEHWTICAGIAKNEAGRHVKKKSEFGAVQKWIRKSKCFIQKWGFVCTVKS